GLSLLLAARRHADPALIDECRLLRRSAGVAGMAVARRRRQPASDSDHVRPAGRAAADRMGGPVAAGIREFGAGTRRQCRAYAAAARYIWRGHGRAAPGAARRPWR